MAVCMWDDESVEELTSEFEELIQSEKAAVFFDEEAIPVGFAQCQLRYDYVEGTDTSPVGYLEGVFVKDGYRKQGYAKELLNAYEEWAKSCGCTEFASDCELDFTLPGMTVLMQSRLLHSIHKSTNIESSR